MENGVVSSKTEGHLSRMALNDNKAGMEGLDREKINKIILETSKVDKNDGRSIMRLSKWNVRSAFIDCDQPCMKVSYLHCNDIQTKK